MLKVLQGIALIASTVTMGLMAGVFGVYAHAIMPGLRHTDDRTFVGAFQSIDRAIINPWFLASFLGALLVTGAAAALQLAGDTRSALPWIAVALALYLAVFVITIAINVPLNDALKAAGDRRHRRPGRGPRALRRGALGGVERLPRGGDDGRVRLPGVGARGVRARPVTERRRTAVATGASCCLRGFAAARVPAIDSLT